MERTKRIEFIDCMRGFTMILVVYSHVCYFALSLESNINDVFIRFRMPLFYFISGFMLYSSKPYNEWIKKRFKNRLLNQFLPTFFTGFIYTLFVSMNPISALFTSSKAGYWFTFVLFEIFLLFLFVTICMDKLHLKKSLRLVTIGIVAAISFISKYILEHYNTSVLDEYFFRFLSIDKVLCYTPFVFFGVACRMYLSHFQKIVANKYISLIVIFTFVLFHCGLYHMTFEITGICGIIIVFSIFQNYRNFFSNQTFIGRSLSYIGKNTLPVYFLHNFILAGLKLNSDSLSMFLHQNWFIEFILCFTLSTLIVIFTLILDKLIQSSELLHTFMFGPKLVKFNK